MFNIFLTFMKARKNQIVEETQIGFYTQLYNNYSGLTDGEIFIDQYDGKSNLGIKATSAVTIYDKQYTYAELDNLSHFDYIPSNIVPLLGFVVGASNYSEIRRIIVPNSITSFIDRSKHDVWFYYVPSTTPYYNRNQWKTTNGAYGTQRGTFIWAKGQQCGVSSDKTVIFNNSDTYYNNDSFSSEPQYKWTCLKFTSTRIDSFHVNNNDEMDAQPYASQITSAMYPSNYPNLSLGAYQDSILGRIEIYENGYLFDKIIPAYNSTTNTYGFFSHRTKDFGAYETIGTGHCYPIIDRKTEDRDSLYYLPTGTDPYYNLKPGRIVCYKIHGETSWRDSLNIFKIPNSTRLSTERGQYNVDYYYTASDNNGDYDTFGYVTLAYTLNGIKYETQVCDYRVHVADGDNKTRWTVTDGWEIGGVLTDFKTQTLNYQEKYYYYHWDGSTKSYPGYTRTGAAITTTWGDTGDYVYTIDPDKSVHKKAVQRATYDDNGTTTNTDLYRLGAETTLDISTSLPYGYTAISSYQLPSKYFTMNAAITNNAFYISAVFENTTTSTFPKRILESAAFTTYCCVHWALESSTVAHFTPYTNSIGDNRKSITINPWPSVWKQEQLYNCFKITDVDNSVEYNDGDKYYTNTSAYNTALKLGGNAYNGGFCRLKVIGFMITDIATGTLTHFLLPAQEGVNYTDGLYDMITGTFYY